MEGLLWKWTNYWSGWQPRWFILDDGILSYYNSRDEVDQGCKGSIRMSVCDVVVDHADPCRLELDLAKEQHFYLKAANAKERQQWLVALGSCKATLQTVSDSMRFMLEKEDKRMHSGMKQKRSELRIYCDLLMQQVHAIKEASSSHPLDAEKIEQCSVLLSETCDTFIHTLEDCMELSNKPVTKSRHSSSRGEASKPSSPVNPGMKHIQLPRSPSHEGNPRSILRNPRRSASQSSTGTDTDAESHSAHSKRITSSPAGLSSSGVISESSHLSAQIHKEGETVDDENIFHDTSPDLGHSDLSNNNKAQSSLNPANSHRPTVTSAQSSGHSSSPEVATFFTTMGSSFVTMVGNLENGVNTKDFAACAAQLAKIFDKLSATAFSPVKNDLLGNVKKIEQKWTTDPKAFSTLQKLVDYEIVNKQHLDPNSATQALLWLTRGLLFVSHIIGELPHQDSLAAAVATAYDRTLKPFHNFVVRGVVSIASRALPYKEVFISSFAEDPDVDTTSDAFISAVLRDGFIYQDAVKTVCNQIIQFYRQKNMIVVQEL